MDEQTCQLFVKLFGSELHDLYKAKYAINSDTQMVRADLRMTKYVNYPIIEHQSLFDVPLSPVVNVKGYGKAEVETWAKDDQLASRVNLAFAPEINTVFYMK